MNQALDAGENRAGWSRRAFLKGSAWLATVGGISALGGLSAAPAMAATVTIPNLGKVVCSVCSSCHHCGCNCSFEACPAGDTWYVKYNGSGSSKTCSGSNGGPCNGNPKQCFGSPAWWMLAAYNKCCCCV